MVSRDYDNFFAKRTLLITGGAGFIGSSLANKLVSLGASVRILDDFSTGHRSNVETMNAEVFEGSILDSDILEKSMEGCDCVFHQAAMVSVPASIENPKRCFEINTHGTELILELASISGVRRVLFAASSAAYGQHAALPSNETMTPDPASPYAESKIAGEEAVRECVKNSKTDAASLRYFNIFGPKQDPHSQYAAVVAAFMEALLNNRNPQIYGDGSQTRDFTFVDNAVHANLLGAACSKPLGGEVFNIGTGSSYSLLEMLNVMSKVLNLEPKVDFHPMRDGDVPHSRANISKATNTIGYEPIVSFYEGISRLFTGLAGLPA
ncbi:MAG: NAD-dependent epimerase/dehydratase family protein [Phycisphaerales bacterium]|nr:NAD-dependent epimerase/dehydratase family protein [Phycisphaerales bacterium]